MPNDIVAKCFCVDQLSWIGCEPQLSVVPNVLNKTVFHVMKGQSSILVLSCIAELSNEPYEGFVSTDLPDHCDGGWQKVQQVKANYHRSQALVTLTRFYGRHSN